MAWLDNNGDIILDAVLTDEGRARLARADGSFKIVKWAVADDEIDYSLYNPNHPSGTAYYDLEILQTPVLEAFTNNASSVHSKLISIPRGDLMYLPVIKNSVALGPQGSTYGNAGYYMVTVNSETQSSFNPSGFRAGVIDGQTAESAQKTPLVFEQGLDTTEISSQIAISSDLKETQYIVEIDRRLGELVQPQGRAELASVSFIDDDNIATYFFSLGTHGNYVSNITDTKGSSAIAGPRGTKFSVAVKASLELNSNSYLFTRYGNEITIQLVDYYYIDTVLRVTGGTTGYRVDLPLRFLRKK